MPPGTGDVALSLSQTVPVAGAIVVTTPQQVSLADSRRAVAMYKKLNIPPLGIDREHELLRRARTATTRADIFGHGGGEQMATDLGVPFLGRIPIYQPIREGSDTGVPLVISEPDSPAARAFMAAAERTAAQVSIASYNRPTIPLTVVQLTVRTELVGVHRAAGAARSDDVDHAVASRTSLVDDRSTTCRDAPVIARRASLGSGGEDRCRKAMQSATELADVRTSSARSAKRSSPT